MDLIGLQFHKAVSRHAKILLQVAVSNILTQHILPPLFLPFGVADELEHVSFFFAVYSALMIKRCQYPVIPRSKYFIRHYESVQLKIQS